MKAELRDSLDNLFPDSVIGARPVCRMSLDVARGGTASVHILLKDLRVGAAVRVAACGAGLPFADALWTRLIDVPVEENTGLKGFTTSSMGGAPYNAPNPYVVRPAPFRVYDAMAPIRRSVVADAETLALRIDIPVFADCRAGSHTGKLQLDHDGARIELQLDVHVYKALIPGVGASSLPVTNWFSYNNIATRHGLQMWSEPYWRMLRRYADLMVHGRQNTFWIPLQQIFDIQRGRAMLNVDRLDRLVRLFTAAGLWYIEGGHLASRTGGKWEATTFDIAFGKQLATSPAGNAVLAEICSRLMERIDARSWRSRWLQHVTDEPIPANAVDYRILVGMTHKYMPGIPILDATQDPELAGSVDIWCPQVQEYQRDRAEYESQRQLGDKVWYYTCCFPGGPWLNRLLDQELLRPVLLGWGGALFGLDGFLHWAFNQYRVDQDPFNQSVCQNHGGGANALPPGDTHIVYPGKGRPWSSLRLEAHREGFEDYELLRLLKERDPKVARKVLAGAIRGFDRYVKTVPRFRAARKSLLENLS